MVGESGKADKVLVCIPGAGGALSNWAGPSEESGTEDRRISSPWQKPLSSAVKFGLYSLQLLKPPTTIHPKEDHDEEETS
jgi:hypothetical protein